ncbi:uncharacterized protein LOC108676448 [Hyalella azteca]|uniref:Uncharacterized protein LOC108676448 n=1 Tax=Hyalella azteca TaxID=294128 RepID=A0A8B7P1N8_HYAAZ|nr:uncharacterized protein LOC108676448 [Hyalella azteca]
MITLFCAILCSLLVLASSSPIEGVTARPDDFRYLTAYSEPDSIGENYTFYEYTPELSVVMMNNVIDSVCATGFWILYDSINYIDRFVSCIYHGVSACATFAPACQNRASSLRYAGSPYGLNNDYYNLYQEIYLGGEEFRGEKDAADLGDFDLTISSLVVTGQSAWTFYRGLNYTGLPMCMYPDGHYTNDGIDIDYGFIFDMSEFGWPDNSIRSVRRGCHVQNVVRAPVNRTPGGGKTSMTSAPEEMDAMSITSVHTVHV